MTGETAGNGISDRHGKLDPSLAVSSVVGEFGSSAESALVEKHPTFGLCFCFVLLSCLRNKSACHSPSKEDGDFDVERKINLSRVFRQDKAKHRKFGEAYTPEIVG